MRLTGFPNSTLCLHVLGVILFVDRPLIRRMLREIPCSTIICFRSPARHRKEADQVLAFFHLLLRRSQSHSSVSQAGRHGQVSGHHRRTSPLMRIEPMAEVLGQAHALELCVVRHLDHVRVLKIGQHIFRKLFSTGHVHCLHRTVVIGIGEQQDFKFVGIDIAIHAGLGKWDRAVSLDVDAEDSFH